jgi:hypothetical protein
MQLTDEGSKASCWISSDVYAGYEGTDDLLLPCDVLVLSIDTGERVTCETSVVVAGITHLIVTCRLRCCKCSSLPMGHFSSSLPSLYKSLFGHDSQILFIDCATAVDIKHIKASFEVIQQTRVHFIHRHKHKF